MEIKKAVSGKTDKIRQKKAILLSNTVLMLAIILSLTLYCLSDAGGRLFGFLSEFVLCGCALFVEGPTFLVAVVLYFDAYIEARKKRESRG